MGFFSRSSNTSRMPERGEDDAIEGNPVFERKAEILSTVKRVAEVLNREPTLVDYLAACKGYALESTEWNPKIWADMSGQNLQGFTISDPSKAPDSEHVMANLYDQFGTGAVNEFFSNVNFHEADLSDTLITPATSYLIAEKANSNIDGATFEGMGIHDTFKIGAGAHHNLHITKVDGGGIVLVGAQLDGLTVSGKQAYIGLEQGAALSNAQVDEDFRIVNINAEPGTSLKNCHFNNVSMASKMSGINMEDIVFKGDLVEANFKNSTLQKVEIGGSVTDADFSGVKAMDLKIDGELITSTEQLRAKGAVVDGLTTIECSPEALMENKQQIALKAATEVSNSAKSWINEQDQLIAAQQTKQNNGLEANQGKEVAAVSTPKTTKAPYIGMGTDQQVQQAPMMAATNDNAKEMEASTNLQPGQERANIQAKDTNFDKALWKDQQVASNGANVAHDDVALQSNLKNNAPSESKGIA